MIGGPPGHDEQPWLLYSAHPVWPPNGEAVKYIKRTGLPLSPATRIGSPAEAPS